MTGNLTGVLVTGVNGQLGKELKRHFDSGAGNVKALLSVFPQLFYTDIEELDICDSDAVKQFVNANKIGLIINCAAYTAVDKAEDEVDKAQKINGEAPGILADAASESGALLIHISTDYVFNGKSNIPYTERDQTSPHSVYGRTKLAGEYAIASSGCSYVILRTSWLYSGFGTNFVKTILRLASERDTLNVVFDQTGTPTNAADLASVIVTIGSQIKERVSAIYNFSNEGVCSWYDFATEIVNYSGLKCGIMPVTSDMFPSKALRPVYSVLNKSKIKKEFGIEIRHWRTALIDCLKNMDAQK
ncbi:MAG: dTDP-4-dehydrorhamnose reductase [Bacteroidetes bacterium GWF2_40_14]|nr:MAG: dTDP-4-dehydrorhamnose reductase [Bacteroidetes bacterium GWF2_40_14]